MMPEGGMTDKHATQQLQTGDGDATEEAVSAHA